jgi:hypothetical protein
MAEKSYIYPPEEVAAMDFDELELCFDLREDDFIFGFSPESLRAACDADDRSMHLLMNKLNVRAVREIDDDTVKYGRPGYLVPLTDRQFVRKLSSITKECFGQCWVPGDKEESGYAPYHEERARRRALRNKPIEKVAAEPMVGVSTPKPGSAATTAGNNLTERADVYLGAKMYAGQLNVSMLFSGSQLLSFRSSKRAEYTAKSPLIVNRISGIRAGTTTVKYTGEELRTGDIETWVTSIRMGAKVPLGKPVRLVERDLLKAMRRSDAGPSYEALREQIARLQDGKLHIETTNTDLITSIAAVLPEDSEVQNALKTGRLAITVALLGDSSSSTAGERGAHSVHIPANVRAMFGKRLSTWFREDAYYGLKNPTARRLFLLYGRHVKPMPFTLEDLRSALGATSEDKYFLRAINVAHTEMFKKGYLAGATKPKYCTHHADGGGMLRNGIKAFAVSLARSVAPALEEVID